MNLAEKIEQLTFNKCVEGMTASLFKNGTMLIHNDNLDPKKLLSNLGRLLGDSLGVGGMYGDFTPARRVVSGYLEMELKIKDAICLSYALESEAAKEAASRQCESDVDEVFNNEIATAFICRSNRKKDIDELNIIKQFIISDKLI